MTVWFINTRKWHSWSFMLDDCFQGSSLSSVTDCTLCIKFWFYFYSQNCHTWLCSWSTPFIHLSPCLSLFSWSPWFMPVVSIFILVHPIHSLSVFPWCFSSHLYLLFDLFDSSCLYAALWILVVPLFIFLFFLSLHHVYEPSPCSPLYS